MLTDDARNPYDGASLCMDHRSSGLVQSLSLPPLQTIRKYFTGSCTDPARNRVKRCIVYRSAGPTRVAVDSEYVCTYVSHSILCSDSHAYW
ncbi:hypothetical protein P692DRAFT_20757225 [Suillus brevipes Sb2]|nr:hypothetical protein P692DRAFT_20757225 [Suillus brevipes Sb2]